MYQPYRNWHKNLWHHNTIEQNTHFMRTSENPKDQQINRGVTRVSGRQQWQRLVTGQQSLRRAAAVPADTRTPAYTALHNIMRRAAFNGAPQGQHQHRTKWPQGISSHHILLNGGARIKCEVTVARYMRYNNKGPKEGQLYTHPCTTGNSTDGL